MRPPRPRWSSGWLSEPGRTFRRLAKPFHDDQPDRVLRGTGWSTRAIITSLNTGSYIPNDGLPRDAGPAYEAGFPRNSPSSTIPVRAAQPVRKTSPRADVRKVRALRASGGDTDRLPTMACFCVAVTAHDDHIVFVSPGLYRKGIDFLRKGITVGRTHSDPREAIAVTMIGTDACISPVAFAQPGHGGSSTTKRLFRKET